MESSLYIHIPFCIQKCDYCDFFSSPVSRGIPDDYVEALCNEIIYRSGELSIDFWKTVYIGGGTPSLLSAGQMEKLVSAISGGISKSKTEEISMEMNPESVTEEKLKAAWNLGVTRISMGIQSFNTNALKTINRHCSATKAQSALETVKKHWKGRLNLDAIAGLPGQSDEEFLASLGKIIFFDPDHISLYTLTVEEETPLFDKIEKGQVVFDFDTADRQWISGRDMLLKKGYMQYEVSNFSKPGMESLHNMVYWTQNNYAGAGAGATGTIYGDKNLRWTNTQDIDQYIHFWLDLENTGKQQIPAELEKLDNETLEFEYLMMGLRTFHGISSSDYKRKFKDVSPWHGSLEKRLGTDRGIWKKFTDDGMAETRQVENSTVYSLNHKGILFLNQLLVSL